MVNILLVGLGGSVGAIARYLIYLFVMSHFNHPFPIATLLVNTLGCFGIGGLFALNEQASIPFHPRLMLLFSVGIVGGFTTFSAFGLETVELTRIQRYWFSICNVFANVFLGMGSIFIGRSFINWLTT